MKFSGSIVALITPFYQGKVDLAALQKLVEWHYQEGTLAIVVCGSTGGANMLSFSEREQIIKCAVEAAAKRLPIIVGCGSSSTDEAIAMAKQAENLGADAILVVSPYYVKPSQMGIYQHFYAIHETVKLPIIIYNNPGRSVVDQSIDLICQLAELPRIVALKDSSSDLSRPTILRSRLGDGFSLLAGDDPITGAYLAQGGNGSISVTANVAPALCQKLIDAWRNHDIKTFQKHNEELMPLHLALGLETNPCPLHYALSSMGKIHNEVRLPLLPISSENQSKVDQALQQLGLI
jgi:4-hydroxy-tetrahydrodipicolinate synthase